VIKLFAAEIVKMNGSGPVRDTLVTASYEPGVMSAGEYGEMIDRELKQWGAIVRETGVQIKT
jgi:tripartite-type tricarboxylate transporter receptor subunit TctC